MSWVISVVCEPWLLHMCAIIFMYMRFVTLLIKLAFNYILLRIDVEFRFNNAI